MLLHQRLFGSVRRRAMLLFAPLALASFFCIPPRATTSERTGDEATPERQATARRALSEKRARHLAQLGVDGWQKAGARGQGVKVAVLDSGFRGYKSFLGRVLPAKLTTRSFRIDGNLEARDSQHGILCGEVIHALAPDAELLFANWEQDDAESFLKAVQWARDQGAQIISCSVIMPGYSNGEGGGPFHTRLGLILGSGKQRGDVLLFASAGNTAERHWAGRFRGNATGFHEWRPGEVDNTLIPWGDERVSVELCCKPESQYELIVCDRDGGTELYHSTRAADKAGGYTAVRFQPQAGRSYSLRVRLAGGEAGPFHVVALQAWLGATVVPGSVAFPADGPEVLAIGAVDVDGHRTAYSACGSETYNSKPDFVAPVPFATACRERPFAGTSAAAPQAASLAALLWSQEPTWSAERVRAALQFSARDLGPPGHDTETGFGLIHMPNRTDLNKAK